MGDGGVRPGLAYIVKSEIRKEMGSCAQSTGPDERLACLTLVVLQEQ